MKISFCSTKGGVGKTTLCANLGGYLADQGARVLLIDADSQPSLSTYYPLTYEADQGLFELITERQSTWDQLISRTNIAGLDLVLSNDPTGKLPSWMQMNVPGRIRIARALDVLQASNAHSYDHILIDSPGSRSPLLDASVLAADLIVSPIEPAKLSAQEFIRGMADVMDDLSELYLDASAKKLVGVLNKVERTNDSRDFEHVLRQIDGVGLLETTIPNTVAYKNAATRSIPVHLYEPIRSGPTSSGAETMATLAEELIAEVAHHG